MTLTKTNRIAVFVDAENVTNWIKHDGISSLISELQKLGQIIIRRAYGVWSRPALAMHQSSINQHGFELIHCYHPVTGKNTADIQMTVDVIECAWQLPNINYFVLVTGDSDFTPVFRRLREMDKEVIGVGQHSTLSECVKTSCSRFIYTDEYVEYQQQQIIIDSTSPKSTGLDSKLIVNPDVDMSNQLREANAFVTKLLKDAKGTVNTTQVKQALINKFGSFDQSNLGFATFTDFLNGIAGIIVTKIGTVNYATLDQTHSIVAPKDKKKADSDYLSILNKHNMRLLSADRLKMIYKQTVAVKGTHTTMASFKEVVFAASHKVDGQLSKTDLNKAFYLFLKLGLISTEKAKNGVDAIKVKKLALKDFLLKIDNLIITTLLELSKVNGFQLKEKELRKITISTISKDAIKKIIGEK
jgi:uncharacterized protein (TIGR00288 family)